MAKYKSAYTGQQIDESVGRALPGGEIDTTIETMKSLVGAPLVAQTKATMTDVDKVYVYTGSESGMTAGHWYYWDGTAWADGGVYNSTAVETDVTLSIAGMAADAKTVGTKLNGALTHRGNTASTDDINNAKFAHGGQWYAGKSGRPNAGGNFPFSSGTARILVFGADSDTISGKAQVVISNTNDIAWRIGSSNVWGTWQKLLSTNRLESAVDGALLYRGQTASTDDLDAETFAQNGQWYVPAAGNPQHYPFAPSAGRLIVFGSQTGTIAGKMQVVMSYTGKIVWRFGYTQTSEGTTTYVWSIWRSLITDVALDGISKAYFIANRAVLYDGDDVADVTIPGSYPKPAANTVANLPKQASGYVMKFAKTNTPYAMYQNADGELWYRSMGDWHMASPGNAFGHPLAGKVLAGVGTSFMRQYNSSAFVPISMQWFTLIGKKFGMTYTNDGLAGCCVARLENEGNSPSIATRIDLILTDHPTTADDEKYGTIYPGETVDYFIIQGGGNDSSKSVPLGAIDSIDDTTFCGALNVVTAKIRAAYPRAKLLYVTCFRRWLQDTTHVQTGHNALGLVDRDYADAMVEAARYNSVLCFDAWHESGLVPAYGESTQDDSIYAWPWISRENKHLNEEGNAFVAPLIAKRMEMI